VVFSLRENQSVENSSNRVETGSTCGTQLAYGIQELNLCSTVLHSFTSGVSQLNQFLKAALLESSR